MSSATLYKDLYDEEFCTVSFSTPHKKTSVHNVTLFTTEHVMKLGRLGNMMFRYAGNLGIARKQGRQMFTEPGTDLGQTFKLTHEGVHEEAETWPVIAEKNLLDFDSKLMNLPLRNLRIDGYLQSFCYFAEIIDEVRQEFTFQDHIAVVAANIFREVYLNYNASMIVGVHVRRGDFLMTEWNSLGFTVPRKSYFTKAFNLMKSKFPGRTIIFIVASDDLPWCRENLSAEDVIVMPPASPAVHLAVLSSCEHVIMSSGTYGWWAGWLANGHVIYYTGFLPKGTFQGNLLNKRTYYPRQWIGVGD
ncbi:unnamed protein product [Candidula unifasciata]|uniref:L-Fucosyltransferase n=1 Tax=Candidula unifasciata TaxID=100452 RepID=A0A8S3ZLR0_9EUPU|nr:unnamed protein product [Candidula unifasciata]